MQQHNAKLDDTRAELIADISRLHDLVVEDLKRRETDQHERLAMNHQFDPLEEWTDARLVS